MKTVKITSTIEIFTSVIFHVRYLPLNLVDSTLLDYGRTKSRRVKITGSWGRESFYTEYEVGVQKKS